MIGWNGTLWTGAILAAGAEKLFGIVADETCEEGVTAVNIAIAKHHLNAIDSSRFEGFSNLVYAGMVEV